MLLNAYQVQIPGHMFRIRIPCWLDVINKQKNADPSSTSMITSEAAM